MKRGISTTGIAFAGLCLASCSSLPEVSLPSVPTSIFSGSGEAACPTIASGPAAYEPPFPDDCRTMNRTASGCALHPDRQWRCEFRVARRGCDHRGQL